MHSFSRHSLVTAFLLFSTLFLWSCGGKEAVFSGESMPEAFTLSFQKPETFSFDLEEDGTYSFALEITYFSEQMQNLEAGLPMYYILEGPGLGNGKDKKFLLPIKDDKGEWRGELQDNDHDRKFEAVFEEGKELKKGKHTFKLYADSQAEGEAVQGMVTIGFKVYR